MESRRQLRGNLGQLNIKNEGTCDGGHICCSGRRARFDRVDALLLLLLLLPLLLSYHAYMFAVYIMKKIAHVVESRTEVYASVTT